MNISSDPHRKSIFLNKDEEVLDILDDLDKLILLKDENVDDKRSSFSKPIKLIRKRKLVEESFDRKTQTRQTDETSDEEVMGKRNKVLKLKRRRIGRVRTLPSRLGRQVPTMQEAADEELKRLKKKKDGNFH